jgi:hypothetical protein
MIVGLVFIASLPLHAETGKGQRMPSFRFAADSSLEGDGFELPVPRRRRHPSATAGEAASHRSHPPKDPPPEQSSLLDSNRGPALVLEYAPLG